VASCFLVFSQLGCYRKGTNHFCATLPAVTDPEKSAKTTA
jgi:hypothetical protein